jgi:hypothetical protein
MSKDKQLEKDKKLKEEPKIKPDPETLHKTDPQENMKGPISSLLNNTRESIEEHGGEHVDGEQEKKK